jgi:tetratricopeptide (TPR) repeat protein
VLLFATSTLSSVALAVAVNVATGGSLPGPLEQVQWLAWPLVGVLAAAAVAIGVWQTDGADGSGEPPVVHPAIRPAELPPDVTRFAGREPDLAALLEAVPARPAAGLGSPVVLGIFGAGGMGKTVLAIRLAHSVATRFPDGQVFVELRGASSEPADPGEVLRRLLHAFGVSPDDVPEDMSVRQALYRSVLVDKRVLLYLDDAGDEAQVRPLLPAGRGCLVLVTSRPSLVGLALTAGRDLDVLSKEAALALLGTIASDPDRLSAEPAAAAEVVGHCGFLPLALSIAGARLRNRQQWTVADLARRLADERRRLDELHLGNLDVRTSIGLSYADLDPVASRLLRLLSLLGHVTFGPGVAAALLGGFEQWPASEVALERLADAKLVEIAGPRRFRFHDLVRIFARERLDAEEPAKERKAALLRSLGYYRRRTGEQWDRLADPSTGGDRRADAEQWFERTRGAIVAAVQRAEDAGEPEIAWQLAEAVGPYLQSRGYPLDLAAVASVAGEAARSRGNQRALAAALRDLGQAERHRSRPDQALPAFRESLTLYEQLGEQAAIAWLQHSIGDTYRESGRLPEAEEAYTRSISIFERLDQVRDAAVVQSALAVALLMRGQADDATALIEAAADRLGVDDRSVASDSAGAWALEVLGAVRSAAGRYSDAEQFHGRSLASFRSRGERYGSALALLNLGRCAAALGHPAQARERYAESMQIFTEMGNLGGQSDVRKGLAELDRAPIVAGGRRRRGRS